jgi:hypothetical protein
MQMHNSILHFSMPKAVVLKRMTILCDTFSSSLPLKDTHQRNKCWLISPRVQMRKGKVIEKNYVIAQRRDNLRIFVACLLYPLPLFCPLLVSGCAVSFRTVLGCSLEDLLGSPDNYLNAA